MRRREFIVLISTGVAGWPLAARAQQPDQTRRIGVLTVFSKDDPEGQRRVTALQQRLQELGWVDGRNVRMELRLPGHWCRHERLGDASNCVDTRDAGWCGRHSTRWRRPGAWGKAV